MIEALRIKSDGGLERAVLERDLDDNYIDWTGRVMRDSGRTKTISGWGPMDGTVKILTDETGRDAYYIS